MAVRAPFAKFLNLKGAIEPRKNAQNAKKRTWGRGRREGVRFLEAHFGSRSRVRAPAEMAGFDSSRGLERNTVETMNRFGRAIRVLLFLSPVLAIAATPNGEAQEASVVAVSTFWSHSGVKPGG